MRAGQRPHFPRLPWPADKSGGLLSSMHRPCGVLCCLAHGFLTAVRSALPARVRERRGFIYNARVRYYANELVTQGNGKHAGQRWARGAGVWKEPACGHCPGLCCRP